MLLTTLAGACGDDGSAGPEAPISPDTWVADPGPAGTDAPQPVADGAVTDEGPTVVDVGPTPDAPPPPDDLTGPPDDGKPPSDVPGPGDSSDGGAMDEGTPAPEVSDDGSTAPDDSTGVPVDAGPDPDEGPPPCDCDDANPCTYDQCDEVGQCQHIPVPAACEDGDPCTAGDVCNKGECSPGPVVPFCDDGNPCTAGECVSGVGCVLSATAEGEPCDDSDTCTTGEQCTSGACAGGQLPDCTDDDLCTDDFCVDQVGCVNPADPGLCDDSNVCTVDTCSPATGCKSVPTTAGTGCDDGDPCTVGDSCAGGACEAGPDPAGCDDLNPCTEDSCVPLEGCHHVQLTDGAVCDDLNASTINDICKGGACKGVADDCAAGLGLQWPSMKVTSLVIGTSPSEAMDIDGDGEPDNSLSLIAPFINAELQNAIQNGSLIYVVHLANLSLTDTFPVHFFLGSLASDNPGCDVQVSSCDYLVSEEGFDESCNPTSSFPSVTWNGTKLQSAEPGLFSLAFTFGGEIYEINVHKAQLDVPVIMAGSTVTSFKTGSVGGAVVKSELVTIASLISAPVDVAALLEQLVEPDIDIDGDGIAEGASVHLLVGGIGGTIVGVEEL